MRRLTGCSSRLFKFCTRFAVSIGIAFACTSPLSAQDRLFALVDSAYVGSISPPQFLIEIDTRRSSFGAIRKAVPVPSRGSNESPLAIGGGRYLIWMSPVSRDVHVLDTQTAQVVTLPGFLPGGSKIVAVDAARLRLFIQADQNIIVLDGRSNAHRSIPVAHPLGQVAAYAPSTDRLFVNTWTPSTNAFQIAVLNVEAGVVERTLAVPHQSTTALAVDDDGRRLFVAAGPSSLGEDVHGVFVLDPQSGAVLAHYPNADVTAFELDRPRRRMLAAVSAAAASGTPQPVQVAAFDLETGNLVGSINGGSSPWTRGVLAPFDFQTGPRSPLYVFDSALWEGRCDHAHLQAHDPDGGGQLTRVRVSELWGAATGTPVCNAHLTLLSPPTAPTIQDPSVSGGRVTLSWTSSYDALHYDIEAGSLPGLSDVARSPGHTSTSLGVDGVPPGRYFVRVRAINWVGRSLPSNEIEVVVP